MFLNVVFPESVIFTKMCYFCFKYSSFKFQEILWNSVILCMLEFLLSGEKGQHAQYI